MTYTIKHVFLTTAVSIMLSGCSLDRRSTGIAHDQPESLEERAALETVEQRTAAYNAHDIEAFLAAYDEDVRVYEFPERFLGEGRDRMRGIFGPQFAEDNGSITVHSRHALGNVVLSDETVTIYDHTEHNIGVYTISDGLIVEVRLIEPSD